MAGLDTTIALARCDYVNPTFRTKCPSLRLRTPPPAQCTMNASRIMARIATTTQKKKTTMPGTACPATVLALVATAASYPPASALFASDFARQAMERHAKLASSVPPLPGGAACVRSQPTTRIMSLRVG